MGPHIDVSLLPDTSQPEMTFFDTSYFRGDSSRKLPRPEEVVHQTSRCRQAAIFENLGLVVKHSSQVMFEEAVVMRAIKSAFPNGEIVVPEVFGWKSYQGERFIYMSLIEGQTMCDAWPSFLESDKELLCAELRDVICQLHQITRGPTDDLIGSINHGRIQDRLFQLKDAGGPFSSIQSFNDFVLSVAVQLPRPPDGFPDELYRDLLPDDGNIYFTHGDLTYSNIMVKGAPGSYKLSGIIDWEQAGWYPEYWEYCKLLHGVDYKHEWRAAGWVEKLMTPFPDAWFAFAEYSLWRGCP